MTRSFIQVARAAVLAPVLALVLALAVITASAFGPARAAPKITICHVPPGNPGNARTISVNVHAWPAHAAHGDSLGDCPVAPAPEAPGPEASGTPAVSREFDIVLCGSGSSGRRIHVNEAGHALVSEAECR